MTTRNKLSEQVERLYMRQFDREDLRPKIERREVALLVDQAANELLAVEPKAAAKVGVVDIPTCMIATYTAQVVNVASGVYSSVLPAFPIQLPMDMGVWSVTAEPTASAYIPIKTDFWDLMSALDEGLLEDQVGFYVEGKSIIYTRQPSTTVKMKLLIVDPGLLGPFDPYPIPANMETLIVEKTLALISQRGLAQEKPKG